MTSVVEAAARPSPSPTPSIGAAPPGPGLDDRPAGHRDVAASASGTGTRRRLDHIDAIRPIKQTGVVSTHALLFFAPAASLTAGASIMLLHVTREAFLFVSACMLTYSYQGLARGGLRSFYRKRFIAVGLPYLCWTAIYSVVTLPGRSSSPASWAGHLAYLSATGYYQLYYLLVIMQFYLVFPLAVALLLRANRHGVILAVSAVLQLTMVSLMHWGVTPSSMSGFWGTREVTSYQFYLVAGMIMAMHLEEVHAWLSTHVRAVLACTALSALAAEGWFFLAAAHHVHWLGSSSDAFQPIVVPFNVGAIACLYLAGMALVDKRRSPTVRKVVRSGSDNSYGVYLAQMVFITALGWLGWSRLSGVVTWPVLVVLTVALVVAGCVALTGALARTPLAKALTGRSRATWSSWLPRSTTDTVSN